MVRKYLYISVFCLLCTISVDAQVVSRISGLEGNQKYMDLMGREQQLRVSEDSVQNLIGQNRSLFQNDPANKDVYGSNIIRLESELYEIRDLMGDLTTQATIIEQEFIIHNINNGQKAATASSDTTSEPAAQEVRVQRYSEVNLMGSYFMVNNLEPSKLAAFGRSASVDKLAGVIQGEMVKAYDELNYVWRAYSESKEPSVIDSLIAERDRIMSYINKVNDTMAVTWLPIYNMKIEEYPILIDKLPSFNRTSLYAINDISRNVRRAETLAESDDIAPAISLYPLQKQLVLEYEMVMASSLDMPEALDSLKKVYAAIPEYQPMPRLDFAEKILVVYSPVTIEKTAQYSAANPVPEVIVPDKGLYYMIQIATFQSVPQSLSFLKGVTPVSVQKMTDGKIRYLAGGFRDYKTLMESYRKLTAVGFKPVTAAWIDGQGVTLTAARAYETAQAKKAAATIGECRIEIIPADGILSDVVKEILKTDAADKSIARVDKDGRIIYSVGIFTTTTDANAVADKIREQETSTEVNVEEQ